MLDTLNERYCRLVDIRDFQDIILIIIDSMKTRRRENVGSVILIASFLFSRALHVQSIGDKP